MISFRYNNHDITTESKVGPVSNSIDPTKSYESVFAIRSVFVDRYTVPNPVFAIESLL